MPRAFDPAVLQEHAGDDAELSRELIQLCLTEAPSLLKQIGDAVSARDAAALRFSAHTLKGALMNFGAERAVSAAQRLEAQGREQQLAGIEELYRELVAAWSELARELNSHLV